VAHDRRYDRGGRENKRLTNFFRANTAKISRLETFAYRVPIAEPIRTSFGSIPDRPRVFVRVEDSEGAFGWAKSGRISRR
jgi:hypothetical protein